MVALALTSNEIRELYNEKYENRVSLLKEQILPARLLFISTTSAFGKSSVYDRLKYKDQNVSEFIGYTSGSGTFHIPNSLYNELLEYLELNGINTKRGYGTGPSRKLNLILKAFRLLHIEDYLYHNIKRGYYIFSNVNNLHDIISNQETPQWHDRPFKEMYAFWKDRWFLPRSRRTQQWKHFDVELYFNECEERFNTVMHTI